MGERSGDLHAANLIKELKLADSTAEFQFYGGDMMAEEADGLKLHYREMAFMGFWEVIKNYNLLRKIFNNCIEDIRAYNPDVLILVDFSGFNMRLAKRLVKSETKIFYYIAPKVWAWNQSRAHKIREYIDKLYTILPFETKFFNKYSVNSKYVGNPLVERIDSWLLNNPKNTDQENTIAILPGSRHQEVSTMLELMLQVVPSFKDFSFVVAGVDNLEPSVYEPIKKLINVKIEFGSTYEILRRSKAAIVTSGTATLETALFNIPQVVCYKTSFISYLIGRAIIKVKYISLVNLIAGREIVKELIQSNLNKENLVRELDQLINSSSKRDSILNDYNEIRNLLGKESASKNVALDIVCNNQ